MTKKAITFSPHEDGLISLRTPLDLYKKLKYEQSRVIKHGAPHPYDIINFIVTSHSLVDWCNKYYANKESEIRPNDHPLLSVCLHISNGAKHFKLDRPHNAISNIRREGYVEAGYCERLPDHPAYFQENIFIDIIDHETDDDRTINFIDFSNEVLSFWKEKLEKLEGLAR